MFSVVIIMEVNEVAHIMPCHWANRGQGMGMGYDNGC